MCLYSTGCKKLVAEFPVLDVEVSCLLIASKINCLFLGTNNGRLRISVWPLTEKNLEYEQIRPNSNQVRICPPDFQEIVLGNEKITSFALSHDNQYLFTGDERGNIFILRIQSLFFEGAQVSFQKFLQVTQGNKTEEKLRIEQTTNDLFLESMEKVKSKNDLKEQLHFDVVKLEQFKKNETIKLER